MILSDDNVFSESDKFPHRGHTRAIIWSQASYFNYTIDIQFRALTI